VIRPRVHSDAVRISAARTTDGVRTAGVVAGARPRTGVAVVGLVLAAFVAVEGVILALGWLVTRVLARSALHREELAFEQDVVTHRTPFWNSVTSFGTLLGGTDIVLAMTAVGCLLLFLRGHGPRLPAFLAVAVAGETTLFVLASIVVHRLRPAIPHLDGAPPTSSFPSGHTAATVALWGGLALGLARTHPGHPLRVLSWVLAVVLPAFVLGSRLYRGMHWPTDVAASVVFTLLWLLLLRTVLLPPDRADPPLRQ
jgi:membrane-associated phospholipid phosphatase